jgi:hypothetical protein
MAKVKYGSNVNSISGTIDGNVYSRNRYGGYVRRWANPVNPNTSRQVAVRSVFRQLSELWSNTLTSTQRTAWDLYASSVSVLDRFGASIYLTGFNHYLRSNTAILQAGGARVDDGPTVFSLPETDATFAVSASEATNQFTVTFDDTLPWCDLDEAYLILSGGSPQLPSRTFFAGPWRYAGNVPGDSVAPPTTGATIAAPFVLTQGQAVWARARIVLPDGRLSNPFRSDAVVGA